MKQQRMTLRFDGLFKQVHKIEGDHRTAGFLCYGWIVSRNGQVVARGHGGYARWKDANSNVAEYLALIEGLEALLDMGAKNARVKIIGDAKSVIDQMQGSAQVNAARIRPLYQRAMRLAREFHHLTWVWMPRKNNRAADSLTRRAMRQIRADQSNYKAALEALALKKSYRPTSLLPLLNLQIYQPFAPGDAAR